MEGSDFFLIMFIYCIINVINKSQSWWIIYIDSSVWIKNKEAATNSINKKDNKCFQYAVTVTLNVEETIKVHKEQQALNLL